MKGKKHTKTGSVVIMILILMTALVAIVHSLLRTTSYLTSLAHAREQHEKSYTNQ